MTIITSANFKKTGYCKMAKELLTNPLYRKSMNNSDIVAYSIIRDRLSLSKRNNWINEAGEVFLNYKREKLAEILNVSKKTLYNIISKLKKLGLVDEKRRGQGKSNLIFVHHPKPLLEEKDNHGESSKGIDSTLLEAKKIPLKETPSIPTPVKHVEAKKVPIKTDLSKTDLYKDQSIKEKNDGLIDIYKNCNVELYKPDNQILIKRVLKDLYFGNKLCDRIDDLTKGEIREYMETLSVYHIDKAIDLYSDAGVTKGHELYFAKCLITARVELGMEEDALIASIDKNDLDSEIKKIYNKDINFDQREYTKEDFESFYFKVGG